MKVKELLTDHTKTAVKEHGMIFSAPLIPRLMDGSKTQTRRTIKKATDCGVAAAVCKCSDGTFIAWWGREPKEGWQAVTDFRYPNGGGFKCPYQVGDRLWVRESFDIVDDPAAHDPDDGPYEDFGYKCSPCVKRGPNGERWVVDYAADVNTRVMDEAGTRRWKPSKHMPRWASRITLEITDVRVERVNQITASDAWAEGIRPDGVSEIPGDGTFDDVPPDAATIEGFRELWSKLHGPGAFERGDWVWALSFKRIESNQ